MHRVGRRIINGVCFITHIFDDEGGELAVHNHKGAPHLEHVTLVARGSFALLGARAGQVAEAGETVAWGREEDHGLRARSAGAIAVNVRAAFAGETEKEMPQ